LLGGARAAACHLIPATRDYAYRQVVGANCP